MRLSFGDTVTLEVQPGHHHLRVHNTLFWKNLTFAVEPGTGRVLAYYGGSDGTGSDYAGWYFEEDGTATGYGSHPPGSTFKVYDLAEALRQNISLESVFDSPASKEFPNSGRVNGTVAGPVRNAGPAACQPTERSEAVAHGVAKILPRRAAP